MKKTTVLITIAVILISFTSLYSENDFFDFNLQIRHRFENNAKDLNSETKADSFNLLRTRLGIKFTPVKNISAFFQLQDSRTFGEETSTLTDGSADRFDLHQAYFTADKFFGLPVKLKLGRMEMIYGSQRLIGAVGWSNIGRSFDGVVFTIHTHKMLIDLFSMKEVENRSFGDIQDKDFMGIYGKFKLIPNYQTHAFVLIQNVKPVTDVKILNRITSGIFVKGKHGRFSHELEFAYQSGKIFQGIELDIAAMMAAWNFRFVISDSGVQPVFFAGIDYLSGDKDPADSKYGVFDTLYATNHKFYGFMDYFTNIPAHSLGLGLMDLHGGISIKPVDRTIVDLKYHNFMANADYTLNTGVVTKSIGSEIDITAKYLYNRYITFVLGASFFTPGDIFKEKTGEDSGSWIYLMTVFNIK